MNIEVYCDEAYPDLFSSQSRQAKYMFIGSLWLENQTHKNLKTAIHQLRDQYKIGGEFKWNKVSPSRLDFYKARFITAYVADSGRTIRMIKQGSEWT